jgi:hypothetical protein
MDAVIMGNMRLMYAARKKTPSIEDDFSDEDAKGQLNLKRNMPTWRLGGRKIDASKILQGSYPTDLHNSMMNELEETEVKVAACTALFGTPDIIFSLNDNNRDLASVSARGLPSRLCTVLSFLRPLFSHTCGLIFDIDYGKYKCTSQLYFWYEATINTKVIKTRQKGSAQKIQELQEFIARFSPKIKVPPATSRKKLTRR